MWNCFKPTTPRERIVTLRVKGQINADFYNLAVNVEHALNHNKGDMEDIKGTICALENLYLKLRIFNPEQIEMAVRMIRWKFGWTGSDGGPFMKMEGYSNI